MNILYISKYAIFPEYGSPSRQYFLSKYLSQKDNNNVMLIGSRSSLSTVPAFNGVYQSRNEGRLQKVVLNGPAIDLGFNLKRIWSWLVFEFNLFRFRKNIKEFTPDVIIVSSLSVLTFLMGVYLKRRLKKPLVLEIRDIYPLTLVDVGGYSPSHPAVKALAWVEKFGYKNADLLMSTLPNAKEHIATVLKKPFKFKWLPMGVDITYYADADKYKEQGAFERKEKEFYVGYAGTLGVANSLDEVFEAAAALSITYPDIKFIFVGGGPQKEYFKGKYGQYENIVFKDPIPKKALPALLEKMDLLISPWLDKPIYKYGISPNKWMDYMYAARPILVSFSGYKCIIDEAECGTFVEAKNIEAIKNGILSYYNKSKEELDSMGRKGRQYLLKHHDYKALADELFESLTSVITN